MQGLSVKCLPIGKLPSGQEVVFDVVKQPLDVGLSIGVADGVRDEYHAKTLAKMDHWGGDDGTRTTAGGDQDAGVVDGTTSADAAEEGKGLVEKGLGLEAGEDRIVLNQGVAAKGQNERRALGGQLGTADFHPMR